MSHTCHSVHDMLKAGPGMTHATFENLIKSSSKWTDASFPTDQMVNWTDLPAKQNIKARAWKTSRVSEEYPRSKGYSLWGKNGCSPNDVGQGELGDCWLISSGAAVAEEPDMFERVFFNDEQNDAGLYAVNFYTLGFPTTIVFDDQLPKDANYNYIPFVGGGSDKSTWAPLLEKGLAKFMGNYASLIGGDSAEGLAYLTGGPSFRIKHNGSADMNKVFQQIVDAQNTGRVYMYCGSYATEGGSDQHQTSLGISYNHAYTLLGAYVLSDGTKLFKVRNPWGAEKYKGPWSDGDYRWTDQAKKEVGWVQANDGSFFIDITTFQTQFEESVINYAVDEMEHQHFAKFNDNSGKPGTYSWCGSQCKKHNFTIKTKEAQKVFVVAHTWPQRSYPGACYNHGSSWGSFNLEVTGEKFVQAFDGGMKTIIADMPAGATYDAKLTFDWTDSKITKDWALHIYSEHPVEFVNTDGNTSDPNPFTTNSWLQ